MSLATTILAVMLTAAPHEKYARPTDKETLEQRQDRYVVISNSMAAAIEAEGLLFRGKEAELQTAMLMMAVGKAESEGFQYAVATGEKRGDHGRSWCYGQINIGTKGVHVGDKEMRSWKGPDLIKDPVKCFRVQHRVLRLSMGMCGAAKGTDILSAYTSGKCQREAKAREYWGNWSYYTSIGKRWQKKQELLALSDREDQTG